MNRKLLAPYGLKFNPFSAQIPVEALWSSPLIDQFGWRLEQQLGEGGFALISVSRVTLIPEDGFGFSHPGVGGGPESVV